MKRDLYSIRMHADGPSGHLSGAEQLVPFEELNDLAFDLLQRAFNHERGEAERIQITIDPVLPGELVQGRLLAAQTHILPDVAAARAHALALLESAGVSPRAAESALAQLAKGPALGGGVMRGAMLVDAVSGERIELDGVRGVRVSRLGVAPTLRDDFASYLASRGVDPRRVGEAMVLASKVQSCAGTIAELCWSDDPSYVTGYVAAGDTYHRISPLKEAGDPFGGRAFFIRPGTDLGELVTYLERTPYLVSDLARLAESAWEPL